MRHTRVTDAWQHERAFLTAIASGILSDPVDAEDIVQEAFARLSDRAGDDIDDVRAWLIVVVRRLSLDRRRSAHRRLSTAWDPTTIDPAAWGGTAPAPAVMSDPADRITLDDEVRHALAVVLDRLTAAERVAFVLHDVFGISFEHIADVLGRTPGACRQLASRARRSLRSGGESQEHPPRPHPNLPRLTERFIDACSGGDVGALTRMLAPDVSGWATIGGIAVAYVDGPDRIAAALTQRLGPASGWTLSAQPLDDGGLILATDDDEPRALIRLEIRQDLIRSLHAVVLAP